MKIFSWTSIFAVAAIFGSGTATLAQVAVGDTREEVLEALGEPTGYVEVNGKEAYSFARGHVILRDGEVVSHAIISEEEAQNRLEATERRREERLEEGLAIRDRMQADEDLAAAPPRERLAFWEVFHQRYPEIDVTFEHSLAAREVKAEEQDEVRDLELRLVEAERMAVLAEEHQPQVTPQYYGSGFPLFFDDFHSSFRFKDHRFKTDSGRARQFQVREPAPMPPTARERAMPLQSYPQAFGRADHRNKFDGRRK